MCSFRNSNKQANRQKTNSRLDIAEAKIKSPSVLSKVLSSKPGTGQNGVALNTSPTAMNPARPNSAFPDHSTSFFPSAPPT